jgi:hypothetical protein
MATLTDEMKVFIVKGLACYDSPSQVAKDVLKEFGVELTRQQVYAYHPDCTQTPAPRWLDLFDATREAFLADVSQIGITHKAVRLRMLDRMIQKALEHNYTLVAAKLLVQVARECGGMYERPALRAERAAAEAQEAAAAMAALRNWTEPPLATTLDPAPTHSDFGADTAPDTTPGTSPDLAPAPVPDANPDANPDRTPTEGEAPAPAFTPEDTERAGFTDLPPQPERPAHSPEEWPAAPATEAERVAELVRILAELDRQTPSRPPRNAPEAETPEAETPEAIGANPGVIAEMAAPPALAIGGAR